MSLVDVRNQISEDWEALDPPSDAAVRYHQAINESVLEGAAARRCFIHHPCRSGELLECPPDLSRYRYEWTATLTLTTGGLSLPGLFDAAYQEAIQLIAAVNTRAVWPEGTIGGEGRPMATGFRVVDLGEHAIEVQIDLVALVDEPNP